MQDAKNRETDTHFVLHIFTTNYRLVNWNSSWTRRRGRKGLQKRGKSVDQILCEPSLLASLYLCACTYTEHRKQNLMKLIVYSFI